MEQKRLLGAIAAHPVDGRVCVPSPEEALFVSGYTKYLKRFAIRAFHLAALRLRVRYRQLAEAARRCPGAGAFEKPPLSSLRTDPYSGKPIQVRETGPGRLLLVLPSGVDFPQDALGPPAVLIQCQF